MSLGSKYWFSSLVLLACTTGEQVAIPGLGTFRIVTLKPKRVVTNGNEYLVPERRVLKFTAIKALRDIK